MELRQYWAIIRRRWWAVLIPVVIVLALTPFLRRPAPTVYTLNVGLLVDVPDLPNTSMLSVDPRLTAPQAAEYLVDDFSTFVRGSEFQQMVAARLPDALKGNVGQISSSAASQKQHRTVSLTITREASSPQAANEEMRAIADAVVAALREDSPKVFARLNGQPEVSIIDGPSVTVVTAGLRERLDLPLRLLLALLAGVGLAFFLHYLDTRLYDTGGVEGLGVRVLGEIPRERRK
ncbi:MAG: hypothetical protein U0641_11865 [Anaerolineae bacterium]